MDVKEIAILVCQFIALAGSIGALICVVRADLMEKRKDSSNMGVCIRAKKDGSGFDMGYINFESFRMLVARLANDEFGSLYQQLCNMFFWDEEKKQDFCKSMDDKVDRLIKSNKLDKKIVHFCYTSDCDGSVGYRTAKAVYELIKDVKNDSIHGYVRNGRCTTFEDLKNDVFRKAVDMKCGVVWY